MLIRLFNEKCLLVQVKNYFLNPSCLKNTTETTYVITAKSDRRQEMKVMAEPINL